MCSRCVPSISDTRTPRRSDASSASRVAPSIRARTSCEHPEGALWTRCLVGGAPVLVEGHATRERLSGMDGEQGYAIRGIPAGWPIPTGTPIGLRVADRPDPRRADDRPSLPEYEMCQPSAYGASDSRCECQSTSTSQVDEGDAHALHAWARIHPCEHVLLRQAGWKWACAPSLPGLSTSTESGVTQKQLVLQALRSAGERGLCVTDMGQIDWTAVLTMRNRISEARRSGLDIRGERCLRHAHRGLVYRYTLSVAADRSGDASYHSGRAERAEAHTSGTTSQDNGAARPWDALGATGRERGPEAPPTFSQQAMTL
jgi:hypothetical protein